MINNTIHQIILLQLNTFRKIKHIEEWYEEKVIGFNYDVIFGCRKFATEIIKISQTLQKNLTEGSINKNYYILHRKIKKVD